jgi:hypothetical protein
MSLMARRNLIFFIILMLLQIASTSPILEGRKMMFGNAILKE